MVDQTSMAAALINHLWQSTLFCLGIWLLALLLKNNQARTRYRLWMLASVKFLFPFALLILAGQYLRPPMQATSTQRQIVPILFEQAAQSFSPGTGANVTRVVPVSVVAPLPVKQSRHMGAVSLIALWALGSLFLLLSWGRSWCRIRRVIREASPIGMAGQTPILSTHMRLEPGVFGIVRPRILLPADIAERLTSPQLDAILAHELAHIRRRDNLWASLHMVAQVLFWFHPAVWWIGTKLIDERERACDELVMQSNREAQVYAEGILHVCKFYVEAPLPCVSGVTGSNLKLRIVRIMAQQSARKLDLSRKLLLALAGAVAIFMPVTFGVMHAATSGAQSPARETSIVGIWQGTLHIPQHDLRTVLKVTKTDKGALQANMYSLDQGGAPMPVTSISFANATLKYAIIGLDLTYDGSMSPDGSTITGTVTQGPHANPLILVRATPETAWSIPTPPPPIAPMAADANPTFEVATIKPSKPGQPGKGFMVQGDRFSTLNTSLRDLICFAYDVQQKQVIATEPWIDTEKYDLAAQPDVPGAPDDAQWKGMLQKLLADRFGLTLHHEKREMSAYVLTVAKGGPKMMKSQGDPNGLPGLFFRQLGVFTVTNATMNDLVGVLGTAVFDRPVVNDTNLPGRWTFLLKWTPDESQFSSFGIKVPPPSEKADAPPPIFTAIQQQIGLKLDAEKTPVDVLVVDHVTKPSPN